MTESTAPSNARGEGFLTLRRVERQQQLIERLFASRRRLTLRELADELHVAQRTVARDLERLQHSGVPVTVAPGRGGGASIERISSLAPLQLDVPEVAALMASLAAVGPSASESAASAMRKLAAALQNR